MKILNSVSAKHKGTVIKINCEGILNYESERKEKDGRVYFGYNPNFSDFSIEDKTKISILQNKKENKNLTLDFKIPIGNSIDHINFDESSK